MCVFIYILLSLLIIVFVFFFHCYKCMYNCAYFLTSIPGKKRKKKNLIWFTISKYDSKFFTATLMHFLSHTVFCYSDNLHVKQF